MSKGGDKNYWYTDCKRTTQTQDEVVDSREGVHITVWGAVDSVSCKMALGADLS